MGGIVGRHLELSAVLERLKAARGRTESTIFIRGEAGIGKSRLLDEALEQARLLGYTVLRGRAEELEQAVPYAPLREALDEMLAGERDVGLAEAVDAVQSALALRPLHPGPASSERIALQMLYAEGERLFRAWSDRKPLVLALDDLHAADRDTISVVSLIARHLVGARVVLLATLRQHAPDQNIELDGLVERLIEARRAVAIELLPLDVDDIRALAGSRLGAPLRDDVVSHVWDLSRGNPFFAEESIRALESSGAIREVDGVWHLTASATPLAVSRRNTILHRVFRLGRSARSVARAVSALHAITLDRIDLISITTGLSEGEVMASLDELVAANVLRAASANALEFVHPIVRSTLYADLGPAERRRVHAEIGRYLDAQRREGRGVSTTEIAMHVAESARPGDDGAVALLADAGDASAHTAPLSASTWFGRALDLLPVSDARRGPLLAKRARVLFLAGQFAEAADAGREAVAVLDPGPASARTAAIVVSALTSSRRFMEALALADELLAAAPVSMARLSTQRATLLQYLNRFDEAKTEGERALAVAGADNVARSAALGQLAGLAAAEGRIADSVRLLDQQLAIAEDLGPVPHLSALVHRSVYLALFGIVDGAVIALDQARKLSVELGEAAFRSTLDVAGVIVDWLTGRWDEAVDRWRVVTASEAESHVAPLARCAVVAMLAAQGKHAEAAAEAEGLDDDASFAASLSWWARAKVAVTGGRPREGLELVRRAVEADQRSGRKSALHLLLSLQSDIEVLLGDAEAVATTAALGELADEVASPWSLVVAKRTRATVEGRADLAREALLIAEEHALTVEAARCRRVLGALGTDVEANLTAAHDAFRRLGAESERSAVAAELRRFGLRVPRGRRSRAGGPTHTEWQLARLVHDGKTNRDIAAALHLSPKTVEVYLTRLYAKAGVANRLELALAFADGRVTEPLPE